MKLQYKAINIYNEYIQIYIVYKAYTERCRLQNICLVFSFFRKHFTVIIRGFQTNDSMFVFRLLFLYHVRNVYMISMFSPNQQSYFATNLLKFTSISKATISRKYCQFSQSHLLEVFIWTLKTFKRKMQL